MTERWIRIHPQDNVAVALIPLSAGEEALGVCLRNDIPAGHKFALVDLQKGQPILKYGNPIGAASANIAAGEWVHSHNCKTLLSGRKEYTYQPSIPVLRSETPKTFMGYLREDGRVGLRNEIWILPTVSCVNHIAERVAAQGTALYGDRVEGIWAFTHPYGCSQLGEDHINTQRTLAALAHHPNAAAVLVLGLGCENNHIAAFKEVLGDYNPQRVAFLNCQDWQDEEEEALKLLDQLSEHVRGDRRVPCGTDKLVVGLKCGGSDGFSGITANPLLGTLAEHIVAQGGSVILTEVPEMFGAEHLLMSRCVQQEVFDRTARMINDYKAYFERHGQPVYENPSPGNKAGGITTLEEKSLGCVQKGGHTPVEQVLSPGERVSGKGLTLVPGPGNDLCSITAQACAGAQIILFTTGRGTPMGSPVPTLKIATNSALANKKAGWIDFNAGQLLEGTSMEDACDQLLEELLIVASGKSCRNEIKGDRQIAIFKDGVTL